MPIKEVEFITSTFLQRQPQLQMVEIMQNPLRHKAGLWWGETEEERGRTISKRLLSGKQSISTSRLSTQNSSVHSYAFFLYLSPPFHNQIYTFTFYLPKSHLIQLTFSFK